MNPTTESASSSTLTLEGLANDTLIETDSLATLLKADWDYAAPFRDTALAYLPRQIAGMLQSLGSWFLETYLEVSGVPLPTFQGSSARNRLRAVISDLEYTALSLADVYEELSDTSSDRDRRTSRCCGAAALRAQQLADLLRQELIPAKKAKGES